MLLPSFVQYSPLHLSPHHLYYVRRGVYQEGGGMQETTQCSQEGYRLQG
jgi:hypothetical protein